MGKDNSLLEAARAGNLEIIDKLLCSKLKKKNNPFASLKRCPSPNAQDASGYSALHYAALHGHSNCVKTLLQYEATPSVTDNKGSTPLHLAAWAGQSEIVKLFLFHTSQPLEVNLTNNDQETALHCASQYGHNEIVNMLLDAGADPNISNLHNETSLDLASKYGRLKTVEILLARNPELINNYTNKMDDFHLFDENYMLRSQSPLHAAARNGHKDVINALLNAGFNVNYRICTGTALHEAASFGKINIVRLLLEAGADPRLKDNCDRTVIDMLNMMPYPLAQDIIAIIAEHVSSHNLMQNSIYSTCSLYRNVVENNAVLDGSNTSSDIAGTVSYLNSLSSDSQFYFPVDSNMSSCKECNLEIDLQNLYYQPLSSHKIDPPKKPPRRINGFAKSSFSSEEHINERKIRHKSKSVDYSSVLMELVGENNNLKRKEIKVSSSDKDVESMESLNSEFSRSLSFIGKNESSDIALYPHLATPDHSPPSAFVAEASIYKTIRPFCQELRRRYRDSGTEIEKDVCLVWKTSELNTDNVSEEIGSSDVSLALSDVHGANIRGIADGSSGSTSIAGMSTVTQISDNEENAEGKVRPFNENIVNKKRKHESQIRKNFADSHHTLLKEMKKESWYNPEKWELEKEKIADVGHWLSKVNLSEYEHTFLTHGYDDIKFMGEGMLEDEDLQEIGIENSNDRKIILEASNSLPPPNVIATQNVNKWLDDLHLSEYADTFIREGFLDIDDMLPLWELNLTTVLGVRLPGHCKRILRCLRNYMKTDTNEAQHRGLKFSSPSTIHKLNLRDPSCLFAGFVRSVTLSWRHPPENLVNACQQYQVYYFGVAVESSQGSDDQQYASYDILKYIKDLKLTPLLALLSISCTEVALHHCESKKYLVRLNVKDIRCAWQNTDNLSHFAFIAWDDIYSQQCCYMFSATSLDLSFEIIMTFGEAFEIAYQLALMYAN